MAERRTGPHYFLVDENLPLELAVRLRDVGFGAEHVHEAGLRGRPDEEIFAYARYHRDVILTGDTGFGNVLQYQPPHSGIVVARLPDSMTIRRRLQVILDALAMQTDQSVEDAVVTIEVGRVRIRR